MIEQTINKDQKGSGRIVGFSTLESTVQHWIASSHVISRIIGDNLLNYFLQTANLKTFYRHA